MSSVKSARVASAALERRRAKILDQIAAVGLPLPGSLTERRTRCGNAGCRCRADPPQLHGPYPTWTRKVNKTTVTRTLSPTQADALKPLLDNARQLRALVSQLEALALQAIKDDPAQPDP